MSASLPLTVQDDIEAKERYSAQQQHKNASRSCNSRRIRLWTLIAIVSLLTLLLVTYFKAADTSGIVSHVMGDDDIMLLNDNNNDGIHEKASLTEESENHKNAVDDDAIKETFTLKDEILKRIQDHSLIVFSKTYCP